VQLWHIGSIGSIGIATQDAERSKPRGHRKGRRTGEDSDIGDRATGFRARVQLFGREASIFHEEFWGKVWKGRNWGISPGTLPCEKGDAHPQVAVHKPLVSRSLSLWRISELEGQSTSRSCQLPGRLQGKPHFLHIKTVFHENFKRLMVKSA